MQRIQRKKYPQIVMGLLILLAFFIIFPAKVQAQEKYMQGEGVNFSILLDESGNAQVREYWYCFFGGDTITRYRRKFKLPEDAYKIHIESIQMDGEEMELLDQPDEDRPEGCAAVYEEDGNLNLEMYLNALNESYEFMFEYEVEDAVILHDDVAEFRWQIISDKEAFDIENITGQIYLPHEISENELFFWGHGPEEDTYFQSESDDEMTDAFYMDVPYTPIGTRVSVRFAMPLELFPDGSRYEAGEALEQIIEEESQYEEDQYEESSQETEEEEWEEETEEEDRSFWQNLIYEHENTFVNISMIVVFFPMILLVIIAPLSYRFVSKAYKKKKMKRFRVKPQNIPAYYPQIPDDMKPAMVYKLMTFYGEEGKYVRENGNPVAAVLADLMNRGMVCYEYRQGEVCLKPAYGQEIWAEQEIPDYEKAILELLSQAGGDQPVSIEELKQYVKDNISWTYDIRKRVRYSVDEEFEKLEIAKKVPKKKVGKTGIILGGLIFAGIISFGMGIEFGWIALAMGLPFGFINIGLLATFIEQCFPEVPYLTPEGEQSRAMWEAFANYLDHIPEMQEEEIAGLGRWRRELVYAVALGRGEKVSRQLNMEFEDRSTGYQQYDHTSDDPYMDQEDEMYAFQYGSMFLWFNTMDEEVGYHSYIPHAESSSSDTDSSGWDSYDGGDGGFSDSGGDYDSGSDGSDFD